MPQYDPNQRGQQIVQFATAQHWITTNPYIPRGTITYETDTGYTKIGITGDVRYVDLPYHNKEVLTEEQKFALDNMNLPNGIVTLNADGEIDTKYLGNAIRYADDQLATHNSSELAHPFLKNLLSSHINNHDNPHNVTKDQVGLGDVENAKAIPYVEKGISGGVAPLDMQGQVPVGNIPFEHPDTGKVASMGDLKDSEAQLKLHVMDKNDPHDVIPANGRSGQALIMTDEGLGWGSSGGLPVGSIVTSLSEKEFNGTVDLTKRHTFKKNEFPDLFKYALESGNYQSESDWVEIFNRDGCNGAFWINHETGYFGTPVVDGAFENGDSDDIGDINTYNCIEEVNNNIVLVGPSGYTDIDHALDRAEELQLKYDNVIINIERGVVLDTIWKCENRDLSKTRVIPLDSEVHINADALKGSYRLFNGDHSTMPLIAGRYVFDCKDQMPDVAFMLANTSYCDFTDFTCVNAEKGIRVYDSIVNMQRCNFVQTLHSVIHLLWSICLCKDTTIDQCNIGVHATSGSHAVLNTCTISNAVTEQCIIEDKSFIELVTSTHIDLPFKYSYHTADGYMKRRDV